MTVEMIMAGSSVAGVLVVGVGLFATWRKNGSDQKARDLAREREIAERDQKINDNLKEINNKLDDKDSGLSAINNRLGDIEKNCIAKTTSFAGRIGENEKDIKDIKNKTHY